MQYAHLGKALELYHPDIVLELEPKIKRPVPVIIHYQLMPSLMNRFCELKEISRAVAISNTSYRILFIAVCLKLYNPDLLTLIHSDAMRVNLRAELTKVLDCNATWISQQVTDIRTYLNPHRDKPAYSNFKNEVNRISKVLEIEFGN